MIRYVCKKRVEFLLQVLTGEQNRERAEKPKIDAKVSWRDSGEER